MSTDPVVWLAVFIDVLRQGFGIDGAILAADELTGFKFGDVLAHVPGGEQT